MMQVGVWRVIISNREGTAQVTVAAMTATQAGWVAMGSPTAAARLGPHKFEMHVDSCELIGLLENARWGRDDKEPVQIDIAAAIEAATEVKP